MDEKRCQFGFSLVEVLFAVMVLTLGLVFVASQFPVGLSISRDVAETTLNELDAHNAQVMIDLQLGTIDPGYFGNGMGYYIIKDVNITQGNVHLLRQVNLRVDGDLVMDDPCGLYFHSGGLPPTNPIYPPPPSTLPPHFTLDTTNHLEPGNIGKIVSPPVDESDWKVQELLQNMPSYPNYTPAELSEAIFDVARQHNYSWCALYRHIGSNAFCFYIFTLRKTKANARYAVQEPAHFGKGDPTGAGPDEDREFPVPWRICLSNPVRWVNDSEPVAPDRFSVDPAVAALLRTGSIIIDGDQNNDPDIGTSQGDTTPYCGYVYEVTDVLGNEMDGFFLRLNKPLEDDLNYFWVFPPAVDSSGEGFADQQPVVNVTEKVIRF